MRENIDKMDLSKSMVLTGCIWFAFNSFIMKIFFFHVYNNTDLLQYNLFKLVQLLVAT